MAEVFISYAREDSDQAHQLWRELRGEGIDAWIDTENLTAGSAWAPAIKQEIRVAQYVVVLLSDTGMKKRGFIHREIREALEVVGEMPESGVFLIPARLEDCRPSHQLLAGLNWVDLFPDWNRGVARIIAAVRRRNREPEGVTKIQESNATARLRGRSFQLPGRTSQPLAPVGARREWLARMVESLSAGDVDGLVERIRDEQGTMIPAGTLVEVVEWADFEGSKLARVKILEGALLGKILWTDSWFLP